MVNKRLVRVRRRFRQARRCLILLEILACWFLTMVLESVLGADGLVADHFDGIGRLATFEIIK